MMFVDKARNAVAVKVTETLTSIQSSVKMPSYAGDKNKDDSKYPTWTGQNGVNAVLDSVPSQGNRMEPVFAQYPELVPASTVVYPSTTVALTEVPNRAADPAIRYLFANELEQLAAGNAEPLAKRNPTALVFGLWDSRVTQTKVQRAVEATVVVRNAGHQPTASSLMVFSRLLFSAYGCSHRIASREAGLVGQDSYIVLDGHAKSHLTRDSGSFWMFHSATTRNFTIVVSKRSMESSLKQDFRRSRAELHHYLVELRKAAW